METTSDTKTQVGFPPGLLESTTFLLSKLGVEAKRRSCEMLNESEGLSPGHLGIIYSLAEFGPASQRDLSSGLHFDASDVVALVDELEKRNWVERRVDPEDRRRYAVTLTTEGRAAHKRLQKSLSAMNEEFLSVLSAEDRQALPQVLLKLLAAYDSRVHVD